MTDTLMTIGAAQQAMVNEKDKRLEAEAKYDAFLARVDAIRSGNSLDQPKSVE